jgi:predicted enzyme related to lactoylglutathione lyase
VSSGVESFHRELVGKGVVFTRPPTPEHGVTLAEFVDSEGARCSLSG